MKFKPLLLISLFLFFGKTFAQLSQNTVDYQLTFENGAYTVWLVPNYNTPNIYNNYVNEVVSSANIALSMPFNVDIISITDIHGKWGKPGTDSFYRIGPDYQFSFFYNFPMGTDYSITYLLSPNAYFGPFKIGQPIALFKFKTNICTNNIKIMDRNDPIIAAAGNNFNMSNNFTSLSSNKINENILEQYKSNLPTNGACDVISTTPENTKMQKGDSILIINVLANDSLSAMVATNSNVNINITVQPTQGQLNVNPDGTLKYTLNSNATLGDDCFTYQICDKYAPLICSSTTDCVQIYGQVSAISDTITTSPNTSINLNVLTNDIYFKQTANITNIDLSVITQPLNGTIYLQNDGNLKYVPNTNFQGTDCFNYKICAKNSSSLCSTVKSCIVVGCNPIIANDDNLLLYHFDYNSNNIDVLQNDTFNSQPATVNNVVLSIVNQPTNGKALIKSNGLIEYAPNYGASLTNSFSYSICDIKNPNCCKVATCNFTIKKAAIIAKVDSSKTAKNTCIRINVLNNDTFDGQILNSSTATVYLPYSSTPYGSTIINNNDGTITFCPGTGFAGNDMYIYNICLKENLNYCSNITNIVTVNDAGCGVLLAKTDTLNVNNDGQIYALNELLNDQINGNPANINNVNVNIVKYPKFGQIGITNDGIITYTSTSSISPVDSFSYTICDKLKPTCCSQANDIIKINGINTSIIANTDRHSVLLNTCNNLNVLSNDSYNSYPAYLDFVNIAIPTSTSNSGGSILLNADGSIRYCPPNNFIGTDFFSYTICDKLNPKNCATALDSVTVYSNNCNINAVAEQYIGHTLENIIMKVLNNDQVNGNSANINNVTLTIDNNPINGVASLNSDGTITYNTNSNYNGNDIMTYQICDKSKPFCCSKTNINLTLVNSTIPILNFTLNSDSLNLNSNSCKAVFVLNNDLVNGSSPNLQYVNITLPKTVTDHGNTLTLNADGSINICSVNNYTGYDSYSYTVCQIAIPSNCQTIQNSFKITQTNTNSTTDLSINKTVNNSTAQIGDYLTYSITVTNNGSISANNIIVGDTLSKKLELISSTTYGIYNYATSTWTIPTLAAGASTTLSITAKVLGDGVLSNTATIYSLNEIDSNVNNNISSVCTSVPILICQGQNLALNVANMYNNVIWYKNGAVYGTGNVISVSTTGNYTWTASNNNCPATGCCPIMVQSQVCCANPVCVPIITSRN